MKQYINPYFTEEEHIKAVELAKEREPNSDFGSFYRIKQDWYLEEARKAAKK